MSEEHTKNTPEEPVNTPKEELLQLTRAELNAKAIESGLNPEKVETAANKEAVADLLLELETGDEEEGNTDEEPESTEELNEAATAKAAAEAKVAKENEVEVRKQKIKDQLVAEKAKAAEAKAKRNAGPAKEYLFENNLKCDGVTYKKGERYKLPAGLAKLAIEAGCVAPEAAVAPHGEEE